MPSRKKTYSVNGMVLKEKHSVGITPAVVVGLNLTGLGIVRSLSDRSLPKKPFIIGIDSNLRQPTALTRLCKKYRFADFNSDKLADGLLDIGRNFSFKPVLFMTDDMSVLRISQRQDELKKYYHFLLPTYETTELLLDKSRFATYAKSHSFNIPATYAISNKTDILHAIRSIMFPCVLKPCYRTDHWVNGNYPKVFVCRDENELIETFEIVSRVQARFVLQEWIEGEDQELYFCLVFYNQHSQCLESFTGRKLRQWPCKIGNTSLAEPVECAEVESETKRLFGALNFTGFGSVEFKRDPQSGEFKVMEPTVGRSNLQSEIATANGINLPWTAYQYFTGLNFTLDNLQSNRTVWIHEYGDLQSCIRRIQDGKLSVKDWFRSYHGKRYYALFSLRDPLPALATFWKAFCKIVNTGLNNWWYQKTNTLNAWSRLLAES